MTNNEVIETLNDLVQIHNDRIAGYEKSLKELRPEDEDLRPNFLGYIKQSHDFKSALGTEIQVLKGTIDTDTTTGGKLYRMWMDIKSAFTGKNDHAILSNAEFGEDNVQKAYRHALKEDLPSNIRDLVETQQSDLKQVHDEVKALRDAHTV
jgi:uncharacterized protein (TIGR02284 family)